MHSSCISLAEELGSTLVVEAARNNGNFFAMNCIHKAIRFIYSARPIPLKVEFQWLWLTNALKRSAFYSFQ